MAKIDLKFLDVICEESHIKVKHQTDYDYVINKNTEKEELIKIDLKGFFAENCICLDISTAIKFAKTLRTEINKAKEAQNG